MNIKAFLGLLESNTYVVYTRELEAMIVDAGAPVNQISSFVSENSLKVKYIVLTHGHYDHADFAEEYARVFPEAALICHEDEIQVLTNPIANVSKFIAGEKIYDFDFTTVKHKDTLSLGSASFEILNMPGHTPGCICLYFEGEGVMFTGDVLFASSFGRTDFMYGSFEDMKSSLRALSRYPRSVRIYPGHYESALLSSVFKN